jgi:hypothetical protein
MAGVYRGKNRVRRPQRRLPVYGPGYKVVPNGDVINDAYRSLGVQGDGLTVPDSSYGLWRSSTNLVTNGGFESNLNNWSTFGGNWGPVDTFGRNSVSARLKFGSLYAFLDISSTGAGTGVKTSAIAVSASTTYTFSLWSRNSGPNSNFEIFIEWYDGSSVLISTSTVTTALSLTTAKYSLTDTSPTGTASARVGIRTTSGYTGTTTTTIDGVQLEQQAYATPYIETNGATASRNQSYVTAPSRVLSKSQGWFAFRYRIHDVTSGESLGLAEFNNDSSNNFTLGYNAPTGSGDGAIQLSDSGITGIINKTVTAPVDGTIITIVGAWLSDGTIKLSVNGSVFSTSNPGASRTGTYNNFIIGTNAAISSIANGEFLWVAAGTGTLSDADAATIHAKGNTDDSTNWPSLSAATFFWPAATDVWVIPTLSSGILQTITLSTTGGTDVASIIKLPKKVFSSASQLFSAVPSSSQGVIDNFDSYAPGNGLSGFSNWGLMNATTTARSASPGVTAPSASNCGNYYQIATYGADAECYITATTLSATASNEIRVFARLQNPTSATIQNSYTVRVTCGGTWTIKKTVNNTLTTLATYTQAISAGDKVAIRVVGSTIYAIWFDSTTSKWSVVGSTTDTDVTGVGYLAFVLGGITDQLLTADDFGGGTYVPNNGVYISKFPTKILSVAPSHPVASIINLAARTLSALPSHPIASKINLPSKIFPTLTGQGSSTTVKLPTKVFLSTGQGSSSRGVFTVLKIFIASPNHPVASIVNLASHIFSALPSHPVAAVLKTPQRIFSAIGQGSSSLIRTPLKTLSAIGQASASTIKLPTKTFLSTGQGTAVFSRSLFKLFTASPSHPIASIVNFVSKTFPILTGQGSATIIRTPLKLFSTIVGQGSAFIVKLPTKIYSSTGQGSATMVRTPLKTLLVAGQGSATKIISALKTFLANGQGSASFSRSLTHVFAISVNQITTLLRTPIRTLSVIGQGSSVLLKTPIRTFSVIGQSSSAIVKLPQKIFSVIGQGSATITLVKVALLTLSATGQASALIVKNIFKNLFALPGTPTASFSRLPSKAFSALPSHPIASIVNSITKTLSASPTNPVATFVRLPLRTLSALAGQGSAALVRLPQRTLSVIGESSASIIKTPLMTLQAVGQGSATFVRSIAKFFSISSQGSADFSTVSGQIFTAAATGQASATLIRSVIHSFSVISQGVANFVRIPAKTFSIIGQGTSTVLKLPAKFFSVIGQGSASVDIHSLANSVTFSVTAITSSTFATTATKFLRVTVNTVSSFSRIITKTFFAQDSGSAILLKTPIRTIAAIGQGSAIMTKTALKRLLAVGIPTATFSRVLSKNFNINAVAITTFTRIPTRTFSVIGQASAAFSKRYSLALSVFGQGNASLTKILSKYFTIAANSDAAFSRALNKNFALTAHNQAVLVKSIFRTFTVTGQGSAFFDLLRHVPIIRGFFKASMRLEGYYRSYITRLKTDEDIITPISNSYVAHLKSDDDIISEGYSKGDIQ